MHVIEKRSQSSPDGIQQMIERTMHYFKLSRTSSELAEDYWKFVERGYRERGWEQHEINELSADADEWAKEIVLLGMPCLPDLQPVTAETGEVS